MAEPCRMILDTDPGIDDAMAILFALKRPGIRLEALTTVFGNTDVDTATTNALRILELAGRSDIPVARGAGRSLLRPFVKAADHVHGKNGLGEIDLPEPKARPVERDGLRPHHPHGARKSRRDHALPGRADHQRCGRAHSRPGDRRAAQGDRGDGEHDLPSGHPGHSDADGRREFLERSRGGADRAPLRREDHAGRHGRDHEGAAHGADVARRSRATAGTSARR